MINLNEHKEKLCTLTYYKELIIKQLSVMYILSNVHPHQSNHKSFELLKINFASVNLIKVKYTSVS